MDLEITAIGDKGNLSSERIGFKVLEDCDLKYYMIFRTEFSETGFFNKSQNAYWFAPKKVSKNDRIVLYTKEGENSVKVKDDGTTTHFFYWGLNEPIFTDEKKGIVISELNTWELSKDL